MRVHIKRNRKDKFEKSYLVLPSVLRQSEDRAIRNEWVHQNIIPEDASHPHTLKDTSNALNKISIISYFHTDKKSGELKLPLPFDVFEFLATSYSIKWVKDKKVGRTDSSRQIYESTWSMHDCEIVVKMDNYHQLSSYLTENKSFKRQDIFYPLEEDSM